MSRTARFTKTNIIAGFVALLAIGGGAGAWLASGGDVQQQAPTQESVLATQTQAAPAVVKSGFVSYQGEEGKTALELLKSHTEVKTQKFDFGEMVQSINGQDGGGKKYWTFYVNGKMAQVGAGDYQTKDSDKIEWKLQ